MHALAHVTPPRRDSRTDHPADATPSQKRRNDTTSPCPNQAGTLRMSRGFQNRNSCGDQNRKVRSLLRIFEFAVIKGLRFLLKAGYKQAACRLPVHNAPGRHDLRTLGLLLKRMTGRTPWSGLLSTTDTVPCPEGAKGQTPLVE
jgi:hypothetical protein